MAKTLIADLANLPYEVTVAAYREARAKVNSILNVPGLFRTGINYAADIYAANGGAGGSVKKAVYKPSTGKASLQLEDQAGAVNKIKGTLAQHWMTKREYNVALEKFANNPADNILGLITADAAAGFAEDIADGIEAVIVGIFQSEDAKIQTLMAGEVNEDSENTPGNDKYFTPGRFNAMTKLLGARAVSLRRGLMCIPSGVMEDIKNQDNTDFVPASQQGGLVFDTYKGINVLEVESLTRDGTTAGNEDTDNIGRVIIFAPGTLIADVLQSVNDPLSISYNGWDIDSSAGSGKFLNRWGAVFGCEGLSFDPDPLPGIAGPDNAMLAAAGTWTSALDDPRQIGFVMTEVNMAGEVI